MPSQVITEAKRQGGQFWRMRLPIQSSLAAIPALPDEIAKLLMYVDFERLVSVEDVIECVSVRDPLMYLMMLDMLMNGQNRRPGNDARPSGRFTTRDDPGSGGDGWPARQLIQVREVLDNGGNIRTLVKEKVIFFQTRRTLIPIQRGSIRWLG